jgi:BirA family biotin operon repressor/biotin-[acetyl-CoA-carboxylase] ligase
MVTGMRGDRATSGLRGSRFSDLRWVEETGSTNRDLLDVAAAGGADGVVLVADHQTAGRGRLDRSWSAPPGASLLVSVLLRPRMAVGDAHLLTTAAGLAAAEACRRVAGVDVHLKWPNDLVILQEEEAPTPTGSGYRKLGGILAESLVEGDALVAVVVGLGLNVNWPEELPADLADLAVALNHVVGHAVDREELVVVLLRELERTLDDPAAIMGRARERSATLGRQVRVELGDGVVEGRAAAIDDDGELLVDVTGTDGVTVRRRVVAGDVVHLRPGG